MVCVLRDLNSTNGTFINDKRIESGKSYVVNETDYIRFGYDAYTWTVEVATSTVQKKMVSFEPVKKTEDELSSSNDEDSDEIEYEPKLLKKYSPKSVKKSPLSKSELKNKDVHEKLDILEERISSLEDSMNLCVHG